MWWWVRLGAFHVDFLAFHTIGIEALVRFASGAAELTSLLAGACTGAGHIERVASRFCAVALRYRGVASELPGRCMSFRLWRRLLRDRCTLP